MKYAWMRTSKPLPRGKENRRVIHVESPYIYMNLLSIRRGRAEYHLGAAGLNFK